MNIATGGQDAAMIELGGGWRDPLPEPGRPRRFPRVAAPVLVAVLLLALGGAAPVPVRLVELTRVPVADTERADLSFVGDAVLLRGQGRLTAYELGDGTPRWSVELPDTPDLSTVGVSPAVPGIAVVTQLDGDRPLSVALDLATGQQLWRSDELLQPNGDVVYTMNALLGPDGAPVVHVNDLRTGARLWTMPDAANSAYDAAGGRAWTVSPAGEVTAYGLRDGRVLHAGTVQVPAMVESVWAVDGELAVQYTAGEDPQTAWFDGTTLAAVPRPGQDARSVDCGLLFRCVQVTEPVAGLEVIDRATGAVAHRLRAEEYLARESHLMVFALDRDLDGGLGPRPHTVIDLGSGRVIDVAGWEVLWQQTRIEVLVRLVEHGTVLQVARLGPDGLEILAQLPGDVRRCAFEQRTLVCTREGDQAILWRLRD
ncbi:outer membrane protein assembly factor BamB family protein [Catellatospora vulcania]|uniref:outer membrane protein assembly factor BamB family protein n=1 Tax=Catellatospora vulcania TaxID=1460450 RepID=UPI0012D39140|nr:PQQ-binding-like beta-propeller repeat protein [Catellatospora vulcania]